MSDDALDSAATSRSSRYFDGERARFACLACADQLGMCDHCDRDYSRHARLALPLVPEAHNDEPRLVLVEPAPAVPVADFVTDCVEQFAADLEPFRPQPEPDEPFPFEEGDAVTSYGYREWEIEVVAGLQIASHVDSDLLIALPEGAGPIERYLDQIDNKLPELIA